MEPTLDTVLRVLPELARKAYPGRKFRFSTNFFDDKKEPVYQIAMTQEQGMAGSVFFCQGESAIGTDAAAGELLRSFLGQLLLDQSKLEDQGKKAQAATAAALDAVVFVREALVAQFGSAPVAEVLAPAAPPAVESGT